MWAARHGLLVRAPRTVTLDAAGAGTSGAGSGSTRNWSASIAAGANSILILGTMAVAGAVTGVSADIDGSTSIPMLPNGLYNPGGTLYLFALGLIGIPNGSRTVNLAISGGGTYLVAADSLTYKDAAGFGALAINGSTSGTSVSVSATSAIGQRVAAVFGTSFSSTGSFSSFNQTSLKNFPGVAGGSRVTLIGDAPGASTVNFSATAPGSGNWGGFAVPVIAA